MILHFQPQRQHGLAAVDSVRANQKKVEEEDENMFHLVSYWWVRRTQYITLISLFYKDMWILLGGCEII